MMLLVFTAFPVLSGAQVCPGPGCLDPAFGSSGTFLISTGTGGQTVQQDSVVLSDGRVVTLVDNRVTLATMIRLNTDGSLRLERPGDTALRQQRLFELVEYLDGSFVRV